MSLIKPLEITEKKQAAQRGNARQSQGPATPAGKAQSAAANLRHGFYSRSQSRAETMFALGEDPDDYLRLAESLQNDLEPHDGLEEQLVTQMVESLWNMERARRMRDGLALRRIRGQVMGEEISTGMVAQHAIENLEPFEQLQRALNRRRAAVTAEEIQAFAEARKGDSSEKTQEFLARLKSLQAPLDERQRRATVKELRSRLHDLMEAHQSAAWRLTRQANSVHSPENLAGMMAPEEPRQSLFLQRMEDSNLRRLWRLTNMLMRVRQGELTRRDVKNADRSHDVDENKGHDDIMSDEKADICGN
jgi:hypothetical protein